MIDHPDHDSPPAPVYNLSDRLNGHQYSPDAYSWAPADLGMEAELELAEQELGEIATKPRKHRGRKKQDVEDEQGPPALHRERVPSLSHDGAKGRPRRRERPGEVADPGLERQRQEQEQERQADQAALKRLRRGARRRSAGGPDELELQQALNEVVEQTGAEVDEAEVIRQLRKSLAPAWGWKISGGGRASHVNPAPEYQATTSQACGLFPFVAGSGSPSVGIPIGRHLLFGEGVSFGPFEWMEAGLVTNPGVFLLGAPGVGKALALDTPVPTPIGWRQFGELRPGDYVLDDAGRATAILVTSMIWEGRQVFEVCFSDGASIVADREHLWRTERLIRSELTLARAGHPSTQGWRAQLRTTAQLAEAVNDRGELDHVVRGRGELRGMGARTVVAVVAARSVPVRCIQVCASSGMFVAGPTSIPTHNSAFIKRLLMGGAATGVRPLVLADLKPDYCYEGGVIDALGGQTLKIGRGVDTINPLDTGPLGEAARLIGGKAGEQLRAESRGRRLNALLALLTLVRTRPLNNGEQNVLAEIVDILDERSGDNLRLQPTVPDILTFLRNKESLERMMRAADVEDEREYNYQTAELRRTLNQLCIGTLKGMFDGQTSKPMNLAAPAIGVDISRVSSAGDVIVSAAILSTWAYAFSMIDGAEAMAQAGKAPRRRFAVTLDEMWKAIRGEGLVEFADSLTRVNRAKGVSDIRATHSLADLEALPTAEDRAKARGFVERAGVVVLGGLPPRELDMVSEVVRLSDAEKRMVAGWSAPDSWAASTVHPGRGKYLLKCGERTGIPVAMTLVGDEFKLYDTDGRMRRLQPGPGQP